MKLRLPSKLQAALIATLASAALTTLSTGSSAQAATVNAVTLSEWEGYDAATGIATVGNLGNGTINHGEFSQPNQKWNAVWNFAIVMDADTLKDGATYDLITTTLFQNNTDGYINGAKMVVNGTTATVTNQGWKNSNTSGPQVFSLEGVETLTFVMTRTGGGKGNIVLKGYANGDFSNAVVTAAVPGVDLSFSANIKKVYVGALDGLTPHANVESGVYQVPDTDIDAFGVMAAGYQLDGTLGAQDLADFYTSALTMNWNGTSNGEWSSTAQNWLLNNATTASAYDVPRAHVEFGSGETLAKTVEVKGDLIAGSTSVEGNYTFNMTGNLNAGKIAIAQGASLAYTGSGALSGTLAGAGTFILPDGASAKPSGITFASGENGWTGTVRISSGLSSKLENLQTVFSNLANGTYSTVEVHGVQGWLGGDVTTNLKLTGTGANGTGTALQITDGSSKTTRAFTGTMVGTGDLEHAWAGGNTFHGYNFTGDISGWTGNFHTTGNGSVEVRLEYSGKAKNINSGISHERSSVLNVTFTNTEAVTMGGAISHASGKTLNLTVNAPMTFTNSVSASTLTINSNSTATFNGTTEIADGVTMGSGSTLVNNGALTMGGTIKFGAAGIENNGTVSLTTGGLILDLTQMTADANNTYHLFTGTQAVDLHDLGLTADNLTVSGSMVGLTWTFGTNGTVSYASHPEKVWTQTMPGSWNYTDQNWNGQAFAENDDAVFNLDENIVTVNAAVKATSIKFAPAHAGGYLALNADEGGSLSAAVVRVEGTNANLLTYVEITGVEEFNVGEGAVWGITADQTLGVGTNNGTISIGKGNTLTLTDGATAAALLQSVDQSSGNIRLTADTLFAGSTDSAAPARTHATGILFVDGVTLSIGSTNQGQYNHTYVDMSSFTHVQLDNGTLYIHNDEFNLNGLTVESGKTGTVRIYDTAEEGYNTLNLKGTTQVDGTLTFKGDWKQTFTIATLAGTGEVKFQGIANAEGSKKQIVNLGGGTIGKLSIDGDNPGTVQLEVKGDLAVTNALTLNGGVVNVAANAALDLTALTGDQSLFRSVAGHVAGAGTVKFKNFNNGEIAFENGTTNLVTNVDIASSVKFNGHGYDTSSHTLNLGNGTDTAASVTVHGDLGLESRMYVNVKSGSSLTVTGDLYLGHNEAGNPGFLDVNGGTLRVGHIKFRDNTTENTITLTDAILEATQSGNIFGGSVVGTASTVTVAGGLTLKADTVDWALGRDGLSLGNITAQTTGGHTITLGAAGMTANYNGTITVTEGSSLTMDGTIRFDADGIEVSGALGLNDTAVFDLTNLTPGEGGVYTLFTSSSGNAVDLSTHNYSIANVTGAGDLTGKAALFNTNGTITLRDKLELEWAGTDGNNTWIPKAGTLNWTSSGTPVAFAGGDKVTFAGGEGVSDTAVLGANIQTDKLTVNEGVSITVQNGEDGHSSLKVADLALSANSSLTIKGDADNKSSIAKVSAYAAGSSLSIENTEVSFSGSTLNGNLTIGDGAVFSVGATDSMNYNGTTLITVNEGGELAFGNNRWTIGARNSIVLNGGTITGAGQSTNGALDFNGTATMTANADSEISAAIRLRNNPTMSVANGATLTLSGNIADYGNSHTINKTGEGTLKFAAASGASQSFNTLGISTGTAEIAGTVTLGGGLDLSKADTSTGTAVIAGSLTTNNIWLRTASHLYLEEGGQMLTKNITIAGRAADADGNRTELIRTGNDETYDTNKAGFTIRNAAVTVRNAITESTMANLLQDSTLQTGQNVTLSHAGNTLTSTTVTGNTLTVAADMQLGTVALSGTGSLTVNEGISASVGTISAANGTISNAGTITFALGDTGLTVTGNATLEGSGVYDISNLSFINGGGYTGGEDEGATKRNGFMLGGDIRFATIAQGATLTGGDGNTFRYHNLESTLDAETGLVHYEGQEYKDFEINIGAEGVSYVLEQADKYSSELRSIALADGAELTVDRDFALGTGEDQLNVTAPSGRGILNIQEEHTVTADNAARNLTLAGKGTFRLQDAVRTLQSGVQLGNDWTGIVEISGDVGNNHNFSGLSNAQSFLKLNSVNTWIAASAVVAPNLILEGKDDGNMAGAGLHITAANSNVYTFNGSISGEGDFSYTQNDARGLTYLFNGDLSNWTGDFVNYNGNAGTHPTLQFYTAGEATIGAGINVKQGALSATYGGENTTSVTVNGDLTKAAGSTLNLTAAKDTTFNGSVDATALTMAAGANVTITSDATIGTLAMAAGDTLTVDAAGHEVAVSNISGISRAIALQAGDLTLGGTIDLSGLEAKSGGTSYIHGQGGNTNNGFSREEGTYQLVAMAPETTLDAAAGTVFKHGNASNGTLDTASGEVSFTASEEYTIYYVNQSGTSDDLSYIVQAASEQGGATLNKVVLADNAGLTADKTGYSLPVLEVAANATATLTATESLTIGTNANNASLSGTGDLVIDATGKVVTIQGNNGSYTGNISVNGGTVKLVGNNSALGASNAGTARTITIGKGGVVDINGTYDVCYAYTLNGGSLLNNGTSIPDNKRQTMGLTLLADSYIGGSGNFDILNSNVTATTVSLGDHTLTKQGTNRVRFYNTAVTGDGYLAVEAGTVEFASGGTFAANFRLAGGTPASGQTAAVTGTVNLAANTIIDTTAGASTFSAIITGNGQSVTKNGAGTLTLSGANTYTGGTTITAGTVKTANASALGTGNVTIGANGTLDVTGNLIIGGQSANQGGFLTNNGGTLALKDGAAVELYAGGSGRTYGIGKVALDGSATIMNRWNGATLNVASINGDASDTLVLKTNQCGGGSTWNIGTVSGAADNFKGTLVLQVADSDGNSGRTATYNFKDGGMFSSATLALQDGPFKSGSSDKSMTNSIVLADSEVKFGGINDLTMEGTVTRNVTWTVKSNSNTDARTLVLDAKSGSYTTQAGIAANVNIKKTGASEQAFTGSTASFNGSIDVEGGVLNIMNAASVTVTDVTIKNGTLGVYSGETATADTDHEGTLTIRSGQKLTAGGTATLNAGLVMETGSTLDVTGTNGAGLAMGSPMTLNTGMTLEGYSSDWATWKDGTTYVLFTGVDSLNIGSGAQTAAIDYTQWVDAKDYFTNLGEANRYFLCYTGANASNGGVAQYTFNGSNVGTVYIMVMPEPTTGTLSLLALAALAARRRRK